MRSDPEPNKNGAVDFESMIGRAKAGDPAALDQLYRRFSPAVISKLRGQLRPALRRRYDTEDLGQSVFAEVLRDLPGFTSLTEGAFRKWLALKTQSKLFGKLRQHHTELTWDGEIAVPAEGALGGKSAEDAEERGKLARAMETMDAEEQAILRLRGDGVPYAEVAERLGLASADAARMRYTRALLRLKERWKRA